MEDHHEVIMWMGDEVGLDKYDEVIFVFNKCFCLKF